MTRGYSAVLAIGLSFFGAEVAHAQARQETERAERPRNPPVQVRSTVEVIDPDEDPQEALRRIRERRSASAEAARSESAARERERRATSSERAGASSGAEGSRPEPPARGPDDRRVEEDARRSAPPSSSGGSDQGGSGPSGSRSGRGRL